MSICILKISANSRKSMNISALANLAKVYISRIMRRCMPESALAHQSNQVQNDQAMTSNQGSEHDQSSPANGGLVVAGVATAGAQKKSRVLAPPTPPAQFAASHRPTNRVGLERAVPQSEPFFDIIREYEEFGFLMWWWEVGSGISPYPGEESCGHARRVARSSWYACRDCFPAYCNVEGGES